MSSRGAIEVESIPPMRRSKLKLSVQPENAENALAGSPTICLVLLGGRSVRQVAV